MERSERERAIEEAVFAILWRVDPGDTLDEETMRGYASLITEAVFDFPPPAAEEARETWMMENGASLNVFCRGGDPIWACSWADGTEASFADTPWEAVDHAMKSAEAEQEQEQEGEALPTCPDCDQDETAHITGSDYACGGPKHKHAGVEEVAREAVSRYIVDENVVEVIDNAVAKLGPLPDGPAYSALCELEDVAHHLRGILAAEAEQEQDGTPPPEWYARLYAVRLEKVREALVQWRRGLKHPDRQGDKGAHIFAQHLSDALSSDIPAEAEQEQEGPCPKCGGADPCVRLPVPGPFFQTMLCNASYHAEQEQEGQDA